MGILCGWRTRTRFVRHAGRAATASADCSRCGRRESGVCAWRPWRDCSTATAISTSDPAANGVRVVVERGSELAAHLCFLERDVNPVRDNEDGERNSKHRRGADPEGYAEADQHETEIHRVAG